MSIDLEKWKAAKKKLGWTYDVIAEHAGVSKRTVEDIFRGFNKNPRIDTANAIEAAMGLQGDETTDEKAGYSEKVRENLTVDEYMLLTYYREIGKYGGEEDKALTLELVRLVADKVKK